MIGVQLEDIDELYCLHLELKVVTHLQELIQQDDRRSAIAMEAIAYLLERQTEIMAQLNELLENEEFGVPLDNGER